MTGMNFVPTSHFTQYATLLHSMEIALWPQIMVIIVYKWWGLLMWEIGRWLGHYNDHPRPQVVDRGTPSRVDKRVAPDREGAVDKQCQGEGKLWSQYVIINREEGKGKPPWLFPKTGYPLGYPEPALQQKTEEREREREIVYKYSRCVHRVQRISTRGKTWWLSSLHRQLSRIDRSVWQGSVTSWFFTASSPRNVHPTCEF